MLWGDSVNCYFGDTKSKWLLAIFYTLFLLTCLFGYLWADEHEINDDLKIPVELSIAKWCGLSRKQAILLLAIEKHENGVPGKEFGIESIPCEFKDGKKSFLVNCVRACETIKIRCSHPTLINIKKLNKRWAKDPLWWFYVWRDMREFENILY
jgi:hypothetical protein